jgi:hypothetical protein
MQNNKQSGFSIPELVVASAIFMGLVLMISSLAISGSEAQDLSQRIARMTEVAQEVTDDMRLQMLGTVKIFGDDQIGNESMDMLDLDQAPPPITSRRLPVIDMDGAFRADEVGDEVTGNALMFAYLAWRDRFRCTSGNEYLVDVFRWAHYYMSPRDGGPAPGTKGGLELVRFVGEPLADADGVDAITDAVDRAEVLLHLFGGTPDTAGESHAAVQLVWSRTMDPQAVGAFRQIDDSDGSLSDTPIAGSGRATPWAIMPAPQGIEPMLAYRRASVASNYEMTAPGLSRFAVRDDDAGFPHGFEAQIIGPTSARQILLHMVLVDTARKGAPAWSQMQTIMTARER